MGQSQPVRPVPIEICIVPARCNISNEKISRALSSRTETAEGPGSPVCYAPSLESEVIVIGATHKVIGGKGWTRTVAWVATSVLIATAGGRVGKVSRFPSENRSVLFVYQNMSYLYTTGVFNAESYFSSLSFGSSRHSIFVLIL
jgi:hypothetical protein